jgi:hypothetical protein
MKTFFLILGCVMLAGGLPAQNRYAVQLTDKNNSPYSVNNPLAFLSQRAIDRRIKQNIAITEHDFPVNPAYVMQIAATGATVLNTSRWLNTVTIETSDPAVLAAVSSLPFVQMVYNVGRPLPPKKEKFSFQRQGLIPAVSSYSTTPLAFDYGPSLNQIAMLAGHLLHSQGKTGQGMVIAVIDAGFFNADNMMVFDSLRNDNRLLGTWDFVDHNAQVYDDHPHGSFVASIMAGLWHGNLVGTAPHASYWLLRSEYAPTETLMEEFYWAAAAEFADSAGADIINSSLGYYEFDDPQHNHTYADMDGKTTPVSRAAAFAASKGMIVCNSAGNEGASNWNYIIAPADADSIISVGAVDDQQNYAWFSSNGPTYDGRVKPTVSAQGQGTYVADLFNNGVFAGNGTSFSSPLIAGLVACLWQCNPNATAQQVIQALIQSSSQFSSPDTLLGYGIPNVALACQILAALSVQETSYDNPLQVYGNPFQSHLEFVYYPLQSERLTIEISSVDGRLLWRQNTVTTAGQPLRLSLAFPFSRGLYFLTLRNRDQTIVQKIIKE